MFLREPMKRESLINNIFSKDLLKKLYYHACRIDIEDNNDKAEMVQELLGQEFQEIGTGTNRSSFLYTPGDDREFRGGAGLIYEIALDRRGFLDNHSEAKRSQEIPEIAIKVYESNTLITVQEYVTLMDQEEFKLNEAPIKEILGMLVERGYIFEDIGYDMKNFENYGYRENGDIVILDLGYIYPLKGNEHVLSCPRCRGQLKYNANYTHFVCQNDGCRTKYSFLEIRNRMDLSMERLEDQMIFEIMQADLPDFDRLNLSQPF